MDGESEAVQSGTAALSRRMQSLVPTIKSPCRSILPVSCHAIDLVRSAETYVTKGRKRGNNLAAAVEPKRFAGRASNVVTIRHARGYLR